MIVDHRYVGGARVQCDGNTPLRTVTRINGREAFDGSQLWPARYEIVLGSIDGEWRLTLEQDDAVTLADTKRHQIAGFHRLEIASDTARALRMALTLLGVSTLAESGT